MNKLFTVLGGKFKFSAQNRDLEYLLWQRKNSPVSSDLKPPLAIGKLLDPEFLIKALKIQLNSANVYKDFVCLSENTTTSSVTWSVTVVA